MLKPPLEILFLLYRKKVDLKRLFYKLEEIYAAMSMNSEDKNNAR